MEKLMEIAKKISDQVEIYSIEGRAKSISFENAKLKDIDSSMQSGFSLRIIKNGKLGFAFTKNLIDREEFLQNALDSLKGGVEALFELPLTKKLPKLSTYESDIEGINNTAIVDECNRICEFLRPRTDGQINLYSGSGIEKIRLMNSKGTCLSTDISYYYIYTSIMYPGGYCSISRQQAFKKFEKTPDEYLNYIVTTYNKSLKEVKPRGGKMKVLFLPETMYVLMWRLWVATSGKSIYEKQSPIADKLGEKIFDKKITIYNDPLNDKYVGARSFDDECIPCQCLPIVEDGVLKNFYYDLHYANKMKKKPTGHGFRSTEWGGDTITLKPTPSLNHLFMKTGDKTFEQIIKSIDRGIIVGGALGAHSGNIPNGDFSVGLCPGLYVENGEIVGRVKDAMMAGNIYDVLKNVIAIEDTAYEAPKGIYPAVLFENVNIATKV